MLKQAWVYSSVQCYVEASLGLFKHANSMFKQVWVYPSLQTLC